jgi:hypothetical protein
MTGISMDHIPASVRVRCLGDDDQVRGVYPDFLDFWHLWSNHDRVSLSGGRFRHF